MGDGFMNGYTEGYHDFPVCNHVVGIGSENVGYTTGITWDGLPFEAEVYSYGEGEKQLRSLQLFFRISVLKKMTAKSMNMNLIMLKNPMMKIKIGAIQNITKRSLKKAM